MPVNDIPAVYDRRIQFYNKLYRIFLMVLLLIVTSLVAVGVHQIFITTHRVDQSTQDVKKSMACVVSLFAQPNRASLTIKDINNCTLVRK